MFLCFLFQMYDGEEGNGIEDAAKYPAQPPPPIPPSFAKTEIYRDPTEFAEVDRRAINVAQEDQKTFTDLVNFYFFQNSPLQATRARELPFIPLLHPAPNQKTFFCWLATWGWVKGEMTQLSGDLTFLLS